MKRVSTIDHFLCWVLAAIFPWKIFIKKNSFEGSHKTRITKSMNKVPWQGWQKLQLNLIVDEIWTEHSWKVRNQPPLIKFIKLVFWVGPGFWKPKEKKKASKMLFSLLSLQVSKLLSFFVPGLKGIFWSAKWRN